MRRTKRIWLYIAFAVLGIFAVIFFSLGLHRQPQYIQNFEEKEYGREQSFVEPDSVVDGLAIYSVGNGEPVLLFPYPHGHTADHCMGYPAKRWPRRPGSTQKTAEPHGTCILL